MKTIRCDLPFAEKIEVHPMSDLHIGDGYCDYKSILERIEYIKNTPNAYCILDGDLMDTAISSSVGVLLSGAFNTFALSILSKPAIPFAAIVFIGPADKQLHLMLYLPRSTAMYLVDDSRAALATPIML